MKIYWHGKTCFEIIVKERTQNPVSIIIDPKDKTYPKKENDILILTHALDYDKRRKIFNASLPGEYEVNEVYIQGIPLNKNGSLIFIIKSENIKMCHLGKNDETELSEAIIEELGLIDILFINGGEIDKTKIIKQLEPKIVIPMNFEDVSLFLKRLGEEKKEPISYYKVRKRDLEEKEKAEIIVLKKKK